jgi:hypothetical protein
MKILAIALAAILAAAVPLCAQEEADAAATDAAAADTIGLEHRYLVSELNLALTQSTYSENWNGTEVGALTWAFLSQNLARRQLSSSLHNKTTLRLAFGQTHSQHKDTKEWDRPSKSTDEIDLESLFRLTYGWSVDPYFAGRVQSSFLDDRDPASKHYLNPNLFTESVGLAKLFIEEEKREFSMRLGGALRQQYDRYAELELDRQEWEHEGGIEFITTYFTPFGHDNLIYGTRLWAYKALYYSESDPLNDDWQAIEVDWRNTLTANITDFMMVNLYLQLLYDRKIIDEWRLKETLSLGFAFSML